MDPVGSYCRLNLSTLLYIQGRDDRDLEKLDRAVRVLEGVKIPDEDIKKNLESILKFRAELRFSKADSHAATSDQKNAFIGRVVVISGLTSKPELNGECANIESFLPSTGRYCVRLLSKRKASCISIRKENFELVH